MSGDLDSTRILDVQDGQAYDVRVRARSALGVIGDWTTYTSYTVIGKTEAPSDVTGLYGATGAFGIRLTWNAVPDVDTAYYLIKIGSTGDSWAAATVVQEVRGTSLVVDLKESGVHRFFIKAYDTSGNESETASTIDLSISAPTAPTITASIDSENLILTWTESTGLYAIDNYEISYGTTYSGSTPLTTTKGTTYRLKVLWGGVRRFWIAARDVAGNLGTENSVDVTILEPTAAVSLTSEVIDNNVLLKWSEPSTHTLPIDYYKVYKGDIFSSATLVGQVGGTFQTFFEIVAATYTYWIVPYDKAGNDGPESGVSAIVSQPPDFELLDDQILDLSAGISLNAYISDGIMYAPINDGDTFEDHFNNNGWTTLQDQIDDLYPYLIQPTPDYAYWQGSVDYGTVIAGTLVDVSYLRVDYVGSLTMTCELSYSLDEITWTTVTGFSAYLTNFQYLRVRLEIGTYPFDSGQAMGVLGLTYS